MTSSTDDTKSRDVLNSFFLSGTRMGFPALFSSGSIGCLKLKNRIVMAPMVRNYADKNGRVTPRYEAHIRRIAKGGVGMMILEASYIAPDGRGFVNELGIHDDAVIPGLRKLVAAAHKYGAKIGPQLYHAGRQTSAKVTGTAPLAPSAIPDPSSGEMPVALDVVRIKGLVEAYADAARRSVAAGFDFVEVHGAHGYLITQFLSSFSNRRTDKYGGSFENRMRFLREVCAAVRAEVGPSFPITVRLSGDELVEGGITIGETVAVAVQLEKDGMNAVHISVGNYASYARGMMIPPMAVPDGPLVHFAAKVRKSVTIPVIAVAKIRDPKMAETIIRTGQADFVALGRTLLADPEWPNKVAEGNLDEINPCVACNQGCISRLFDQKDVWCTVNPETGRELLFDKKPKKRMTFAVIGGGAAGLSAARTAASRGHRVVLYEKSARLGGQMYAAAAAPYREGWEVLRKTFERDIKRLGVVVHLRQEFTAAHAAKENIDAVIVAIGSSPVRPKIPGVGRTNVVISRDLLEGKAMASGKVVVIGGGCAGAQTSEYLAKSGLDVTLLEAGGNVALDAPVDERNLLLRRLAKLGVVMLTNTRAMSIGPSTVSVEDYKGPRMLPADTVVICLGSQSNDGITVKIKGYAKKVRMAGDAVEPRRITEAVAEGALAVLDLE